MVLLMATCAILDMCTHLQRALCMLCAAICVTHSAVVSDVTCKGQTACELCVDEWRWATCVLVVYCLCVLRSVA